jgi:hypothetical protein
MEELPLEKVYEILLPLALTDLASFCQTNRQFSDVCRDQYFWQLKYKRDYGPVNFADLIHEFPDVYPDNWLLAYQYRSLTTRYANISLAERTTLDDIRQDLESGRIKLTDISPSALKLLGLWSPQQLLPQFIQAYRPANPEMTDQEFKEVMEDILESDGVHVGDKKANLIMDQIIPTTNLVGFASDNDRRTWFRADNEDEEAEAEAVIIHSNDIVTPRIITIVIDIYDSKLVGTAIRKGLPPAEYPHFEYTYTSTGSGFSLMELYQLAKESVRKYLYIARIIFSRAYYDLNNIHCNEIQYRHGKYYPQARPLRGL